ncbi:MAG TPA: NAD(P)-dependent alcohol dehydrogenase [Blastocatellia bacterium]|nr:NAD(P)-dependent alcohol dehydrogenase [Blastocatellia bacterium]
MRALRLNAFGLDNLALEALPDPTPGPGQVVVKMHAASLNFRDYLIAMGQYNPKLKLPITLCSDGAGEVVAVGAGVTRVKVGDRITPTFMQGWIAGEPRREFMFDSALGSPLDGVLTELMLVSEQGVVRSPANLTDLEAATLPCAALTAWSAIVKFGQVKPGDTVLIQGTGGVALFALQFAKLVGARVIITSKSDDKLARCKTMGADHTINYATEPKWEKVAAELTQGRGVDHLVELGGAATLNQSIRATRMGGTISLIGVLTGPVAQVQLPLILMQSMRIQGVTVGSREDHEAMVRAIEQNDLKPVISHVYEFENAVEAVRALPQGEHFGKIAIRF